MCRVAVNLPDIKQRIVVDDSELNGLSTRMGGLGATLGTVVRSGAVAAATALAGFVVAGVKGAVEVDRGLREVNTLFGLTGKAAEDSFEQMKGGVKKLSGEIGVAQDVLVKGLYQAISAGVPKDNVFEFLEVAAKAAVAGVTTTEVAVDGLTTVINAWGLEVSESQAVADSMFAAVRDGKTTFEELASSMFQVAPSAAAASISYQEVNAALATMTAAGTPTAVAATRIRSAIDELNDPTKKAAQEFERIAGVSFRDFIAAGGTLNEALVIMQGEAERTGGKIGDYFSSVEASSAANVLGATSADKFADALANQENAAGGVSNAFDEMDKTTARHWERFKVNIQNAAIAIGDWLLPKLNAILEWAMVELPIVAQKFREGWRQIEESWIFEYFAEGFRQIKDAAERELPGVWAKFEQGWQQLSDGAVRTWDAFAQGWQQLSDGAVRAWDVIAPAFAQGWEQTVTGATYVWDAFAQGWQQTSDGAVRAWDTIAPAFAQGWEQLSDGATYVWEAFAQGWQQTSDGAVRAWDTIGPAFAQGWEQITSGATYVWEAFAQGWQQLSDGASTAWSTIGPAFAQGWEQIQTGAGAAWDAFAQGWQQLSDGAGRAWDTIGPAFAQGWQQIQTGAETVWQRFGEGWEQIKSGATAVWDTIGPAFAQGWEQIRSGAETAWQRLTEGWEQIKTAATSAWTFVSDAWTQGWEQIKTAASSGWEFVSTKFTEWKDRAVAIVGDLRDRAVERFTELKDRAAERLTELKDSAVARATELKDSAVARFTELKDTAVARFTELKDTAVARATELKDSAVARATELKDTVVARFTELKDTAVARFTELKDSAVARATELKDTAVARFTELKDTAVARFTELKDSAVARATELKDTAVARLTELKDTAGTQMAEMKARVGARITEMKDTAISTVRTMMARMLSGVTTGAIDIVSLVAGMPGRILRALGNVGTLLYNAGQRIMWGLRDGINNAKDAVIRAASSVAGSIARLLPGSPVREGPLRVLNRGYAGGQISRMLADGIRAQIGDVRAAADALAAAATVDVTPTVGRFAGLGVAADAVSRSASTGLADQANAQALARLDELTRAVRDLGERPIDLDLDLGDGITARYRLERTREARARAVKLGAR
jgi:TP901 family phage tail tape measure protein